MYTTLLHIKQSFEQQAYSRTKPSVSISPVNSESIYTHATCLPVSRTKHILLFLIETSKPVNFMRSPNSIKHVKQLMRHALIIQIDDTTAVINSFSRFWESTLHLEIFDFLNKKDKHRRKILAILI